MTASAILCRNSARTKGFASRRQFRSRQSEFAVATEKSKQRRPLSYVEFLWSLPARKTLPELLRVSSR
jgi:hypothetical protein